MHTNRRGAFLSSYNFTEMALNADEAASAALCFQSVNLKHNLKIVVLTLPVHNIKSAFLQQCLEQVDMDLQSVGVFIDAMVSDNALVNSQMVCKMRVNINEVINVDGTTETEYGCLVKLNGRDMSWIPDPMHALKNIGK